MSSKPLSYQHAAPFGTYAPSPWLARLIGLTRQCQPSWRGKRLAFFLRGIALRLLNGQPLDVESMGAKFRLLPYHNVCEKRILFTPQYFDADERALLKAHLHQDFVFIDIGANIGGYSLYLGTKANPKAKIFAIEPQPDIYERLVYNIQQNEGAAIKALACAIADRDAPITLFVNPKNSGETSMRLVNQEPHASQIEVAGKTLLTLLQEENLTRIDAIKLDVEGAEDLILEPFFHNAPQALWPSLILMEYGHNRWSVDLTSLLVSFGYHEIMRKKTNIAFARKA